MKYIIALALLTIFSSSVCAIDKEHLINYCKEQGQPVFEVAKYQQAGYSKAKAKEKFSSKYEQFVVDLIYDNYPVGGTYEEKKKQIQLAFEGFVMGCIRAAVTSSEE